MSEENRHLAALDLPDGAVVQSSILIVSFFDAEGGNRFGYATQGESALSGLLGLLDLARFDLMGVYPPVDD